MLGVIHIDFHTLEDWQITEGLDAVDRKLQAWAWHDIRLTYWRNMGPARLPCLCYTMIHHDTSHKNAKTVARDLHQATSTKKTMSSSLSKSWPSLEAPGRILHDFMPREETKTTLRISVRYLKQIQVSISSSSSPMKETSAAAAAETSFSIGKRHLVLPHLKVKNNERRPGGPVDRQCCSAMNEWHLQFWEWLK